jgi:hypothetical protein
MLNKLECFITQGRERLPGINTLAYWVRSLVTKKRKCLKYGPWGHIHNIPLTLQLRDGPNNLGYCLTIRLKGLSGRNTLAYCAHLKYKKKMMYLKYGPFGHIHNTSFSLQLTNGPNNLGYYFTISWEGL